jgi:hypothetical protein
MTLKTAHIVKWLSHPFIGTSSPGAPTWWKPWTNRCAAVDCPYRGKLWPSWLRTSAGILFDGRWYCEPRCFQSALEFRLSHLRSGFHARKTKPYRLPIGLLLISRGVISSEQLRHALRLQREAATGRLGEWFCRMGVVGEEHIAAALAQQWGCAVFPLDNDMTNPSWQGRIPWPLLDSARAVLAHASPDGRVIHLAFGDHLDHFLLYAVEQMLDCRTVACVAPQTRIAQSLTCMRLQAEKVEICFDSIRDPREMAQIACNYAAELQATRVAVARLSAHIWVRFFSGGTARDLLFRILQDSPSRAHLAPLSARAKALPNPADSTNDGVRDASGLA